MSATTCFRSRPFRKMREGKLDLFLSWPDVPTHLNSLACFDRSDNSWSLNSPEERGLARIAHADFAHVRRERVERLQFLSVRPRQRELQLHQEHVVVDVVADAGGCVDEHS